jgi:hypothetical protein
MKSNWLKIILPHVYAILIFIALSFLFCSPVMEGMQLRQTDNIAWQGAQQEASEYHHKTGIAPLWTNSMFSGMPTYLIMMPTTNYAYHIHNILTLGLPKPVSFFFLGMLGFYFLLSVMGFRTWINIIGAIAFAFSSFYPVSIAAGHDTKILSMAYMAPVIAGIILTYRGKLLLGGITTSIMLCMLIANNHYQIVYYTLIIAVTMGITYLVHAIRTQTVPQFIKATLVLIVFGLLSLLPSTVSLWTTYEYSKYTMRAGHSELVDEKAPDSNNKTKNGLDKDYAFRWSMGIMETFTTLVPDLYGGSNGEKLGPSSKTYQTLTGAVGAPPAQAEQFTEHFSLYWGPQPFTEGPVYFGAAILFLFVLSLFIIKSWQKWWMLAVAIIGLILAWGNHLAFLNYFLFDHLPMYNKFRAPTMALVLPMLMVPLMACWALNEIIQEKYNKAEFLKILKKAFLITGGICVVLILGSWGGFFEFMAPNDQMKAYYEQIFGKNPEVMKQMVDAMIADRASALRADAFRSLILISLVAGFIWMLVNQKMKLPLFLFLTGLVVTVDLLQVDKRYLNKDNFVTPADLSGVFAPSPVDLAIKQDPDPDYRVFNVTSKDPFSDAVTSYHHKSIGGYHAAKLNIYQDLIEHQIYKNNIQVLNMLNTKYIIMADQQGQPTYQVNPGALGNAWFVSGINWVDNANAEMSALDHFNPKDTAVIDKRFESSLKGYTFGKDSTSHIKLTEYGLNTMKYTSSNKQDGFAVFSEIYYPAGWNVYIDGKLGEIIRVDYALRGVKIPAGEHKIEMVFAPRAYYLGNTITTYSSIMMWILLLVALGIELRKKIQAEKNATPDKKSV